MFCIVLSHPFKRRRAQVLKPERDSRAVIKIIGKTVRAGRYISHYDMHIHIRPFRGRKSIEESAGPEGAAGGGKREREREDNLLCCQYVAHNDRLLDFSDMAIIVAADLDRSSLA